MVDHVREMTLKDLQYGKYGWFEHLLFCYSVKGNSCLFSWHDEFYSDRYAYHCLWITVSSIDVSMNNIVFFVCVFFRNAILLIWLVPRTWIFCVPGSQGHRYIYDFSFEGDCWQCFLCCFVTEYLPQDFFLDLNWSDSVSWHHYDSSQLLLVSADYFWLFYRRL